MDNYTGPYISDGKVQESVEFGATVPISDLDRASRLHDSAYAHYKKNDRKHLTAADAIYNDEVKRLGRLGKIAGDVVLYGNYTARSAEELAADVAYGAQMGGAIGAVGGLIVGGVTNAMFNVDWMLHSKEYIHDVQTYYATDPYTGVAGYYNVAPKLVKVDRMPQAFPIVDYDDDISPGTYTQQPAVAGVLRKPPRRWATITRTVTAARRRHRKSTKFSQHAQNQ